MGTVLHFPRRPRAELRLACDVIWMPGLYTLDSVARAALIVLAAPEAEPEDAYQAGYLLSTMNALAPSGGPRV